MDERNVGIFWRGPVILSIIIIAPAIYQNHAKYPKSRKPNDSMSIAVIVDYGILQVFGVFDESRAN